MRLQIKEVAEEGEDLLCCCSWERISRRGPMDGSRMMMEDDGVQ